MANFKIFQDQAQQLKVQIYGSDTNSPLQTDSSGNLNITTDSSTALAVCTTATVPISVADTLAVCTTATVPISVADVLAVCTTATVPISVADTLAVCTTATVPISVADVLSVCTTATVPISAASVLAVCTTSTVPVTASLAVTDDSYVAANIGFGGGGYDKTVLGVGQWTYGVVNTSAAGGSAKVYLEISPDGSHWITDGAVATIEPNALETFVPTIFLKYARLYYYALGTSPTVTLNLFFQGNSGK